MNPLSCLLASVVCTAMVCAQVPAPKAVPERAVYIPYERLWEVFEKEGRGVFLPYEDYQRLREAAAQREKAPAQEPVASLVAEASGTVVVTGTVANVEAAFRIEILAKGWQRVPLGLRDVAVTRATVGEAPARLVYDPEVGYALLVNNDSGKPQTVALHLEFAKACTTAPGRNAVSFESPPAPVGRWQIRIPEPGVKVEVKPVVAATEATAGDGKSTVVNAFVGATPALQIAWTPKAEGARGLQALVAVAAEVSAHLDEGIARVRARLVSNVTRAEVASQTLLVPGTYRVVNVFDENVRAWSVKREGETQEVLVEFFRPVLGRQELLVELERLANEATVALPAVAVRGASREQGMLVVGVAEGLRAEVVRRERLAQQDLADLTKGSDLAQGGPWQFGYRFAAMPYELNLRMAKVEPRVLASSLAEIQLSPEQLRLDFASVFDVQRAGLFRVDLALPEGFAIEEVAGFAGDGIAAAVVDGFHPGEAADGMVPMAVNLGRQAKGRTGLRVRLVRKLNEPGLLRPGEKAAVFDLVTPRLVGGMVERETGGLVVYAPSSLRVTPLATPGLRAVAHDQALAGVPSIQPSGTAATLAYAYAEGSARLRMEAHRRPPFVTVRQVLRPTFGSASVRYSLTLHLDVQYSGIERLRLDLPKELATVRVESRDLRLVSSREESPADLAEGHAVWYLEPETEFFGSRAVLLTWTASSEALDVGKSLSVSVPRVAVRSVDRTFGQILLNREEGIDVQAVEVEGLRPIDPRHDLMAGAKADGAVRAFEFHGDWRLTVRATRYEAESVKSTSIERGLVRMVLTRGNVTSVQAVYKLSTMRQRLVLALPEGVALDTQHLWLNGRSASLERGEEGTYLVPLPGLAQGQPFLMELRYTVPGGGVLAPPSFPEEPAVQRIYLSVHVPSEMVYLGHRGYWHPEFRWGFGQGSTLRPVASRRSESLAHWVCDGLSADEGQLMNFATDGFHLLYSTLRPRSGEAGALRIFLGRSWQIRGLLVAIILVVGLATLRGSFTSKVAGALAVLVGWILLAMVLPSFARGMLGGAAMGAVLVVGAVWILWCLMVLRPRFQFVTFGDGREGAADESVAAPAEQEESAASPEEQGGADHV